MPFMKPSAIRGLALGLSLLLLASCHAPKGDLQAIPSAPLQESGSGVPPALDSDGETAAGEESASALGDAVADAELSGLSELSGLPAAGQEGSGIASFDLVAARLEPSCYLSDRDSFFTRSYHDMSVLYPVGFSPEGAFAYISEETRDGRGDSIATFVIQDLVSDELLWTLESPSSEDYGGGAGYLERFLEENQVLIDDRLLELGVQVLPCRYGCFPYDEDGLSFDAHVESLDTGRLMHDMFGIIRYSCVVTDGRGHAKKIVADKERAAAEAFPCGYFKSPFEDRLAVVLAEAVYGFEGCDILYSVAGCDMHRGF